MSDESIVEATHGLPEQGTPSSEPRAAENSSTPRSVESADADGAQEQSQQLDGAALEEESEIAADYLEELLDIADLDGDIEIEVHQNRSYLSVVAENDSDDLEILVGPHGEVLDALQELVRLSVLASTGQRSRLILDIAGHRARRAVELTNMAHEVMERVRGTGEDEHLPPMTPYERKLVHDAVAEGGMVSESEGEGSGRHIVIRATAGSGE